MARLNSPWVLDLKANTGRTGYVAAIYAWFMAPGFKAAMLYRACRRAYAMGAIGRLISKVLWRWNVASTGCYLSPLASIGPGITLPHAIGVVIGEGVVVGSGVTIYQHVTLGRARNGEADYPIVGDRVVIYAGAAIVGGITVGKGAVIGANSVVTRSVPDEMIAVGVPAGVRPPG